MDLVTKMLFQFAEFVETDCNILKFYNKSISLLSFLDQWNGAIDSYEDNKQIKLKFINNIIS